MKGWCGLILWMGLGLALVVALAGVLLGVTSGRRQILLPGAAVAALVLGAACALWLAG